MCLCVCPIYPDVLQVFFLGGSVRPGRAKLAPHDNDSASRRFQLRQLRNYFELKDPINGHVYGGRTELRTEHTELGQRGRPSPTLTEALVRVYAET